MTDFAEPQTWYRPARWGEKLLDELTVLGATEHMITVVEKYRKSGSRKQQKAGATPSKREALESMLESAKRSEQFAMDDYSRAVQKRKNIEQALKDTP